MSSLFAMGHEVAAGCDVTERKAIEKQLKTLMLRFDQLTGSAQQRMLDLEQAMKVVIVHYIFFFKWGMEVNCLSLLYAGYIAKLKNVFWVDWLKVLGSSSHPTKVLTFC